MRNRDKDGVVYKPNVPEYNVLDDNVENNPDDNSFLSINDFLNIDDNNNVYEGELQDPSEKID
jgi:hypothetical protein